ncbi:serine protease inhibitor [Hyphobacterium sp. SN044]|uniref:serine protease inhibitor n=1 Tax=Hyphobacterium sp. SN044 TaxID=2912575 RepID=UPI001F228B58|nr:serine protease inhibitor [Hyphobacterium sp. SN044]MCF8881050.1 serine protease inhibitor [Hyphobacterium sp. SN044]
MATQKQEWPELVGKTGEEAKEQVLKDRPDAYVEIKGERDPCTLDFRPNRVRIFVDNDSKVVSVPRTG